MSMAIRPKDLVELGLYGSEREVVEEGLRHILRAHPEYRLEIAVYRFQRRKISLGKAAELAGNSPEEMREALKNRGVPLNLGSREELRQQALAAEKAHR